jgi:hypothetical protein
LKRAVIVVGGWEDVEGTCGASEVDGEKGEGGGTWEDGGVASGSVEKRIPVETMLLMSKQHIQYVLEHLTSCTLFPSTEI